MAEKKRKFYLDKMWLQSENGKCLKQGLFSCDDAI